jgi:4-hydroxybenzoyl-CoA reductase subunit beta
MLPQFELMRPALVSEAIVALQQFGADAQIIAGGTDLVPSLRQGLFAPRVLIDLKSVRELDGLAWNNSTGLSIGALVRISNLAGSAELAKHFPVLQQAAQIIAGPQIRNMGTAGGNLCLDTRCLYYNQSEFWRGSIGGCLKKDGSVCHVAPGADTCWAVFSGDLAPALLTLDASVELQGSRGHRTLPLAEFYLNDGILRNHRAPDEILTRILIPARSADWKGVYHKFRIRQSIDYPLAGVAVSMRLNHDGTCQDVRVALTAVNPSPRLVAAAEHLRGKAYSRAAVEEVAHQALCTAKPLRTSASTMTYRRHMVRVFVRRALTELWAGGQLPAPPN